MRKRDPNEGTISGDEFLSLCERLKREGRSIACVETVGLSRYRVTLATPSQKEKTPRSLVEGKNLGCAKSIEDQAAWGYGVNTPATELSAGQGGKEKPPALGPGVNAIKGASVAESIAEQNGVYSSLAETEALSGIARVLNHTADLERGGAHTG